MFTAIGADNVGRQFYACLYTLDCLANLPWGEDPFDCVVFLCDKQAWREDVSRLSRALASTNTDWIQVAGDDSEELHDAVDQASVDIGRQDAVGDGSPMTSWHDDARTPDQMAEVAELCFGAHERVLVLVVGREHDLAVSVAALQQRLPRRCS
jgi:hypothetical protein